MAGAVAESAGALRPALLESAGAISHDDAGQLAPDAESHTAVQATLAHRIRRGTLRLYPRARRRRARRRRAPHAANAAPVAKRAIPGAGRVGGQARPLLSATLHLYIYTLGIFTTQRPACLDADPTRPSSNTLTAIVTARMQRSCRRRASAFVAVLAVAQHGAQPTPYKSSAGQIPSGRHPTP